MVEKDIVGGNKEAQATTQKSSNDTGSQVVTSNSSKYSWFMPGEKEVTKIPLKNAISKKPSKSGETTKPAKEKTKIKNLVLTNYRIAFLDKENNFFKDKRKKKQGMSERNFFFYDNNAFEKYLENVALSNEKVVEQYKKENPKFAEYYEKHNLPGKFIKKLVENGYVSAAYVLDGIAAGSVNEFMRGTMNNGILAKVAKSYALHQGLIPGLDAFKKGFAMQGRGILLERVRDYDELLKNDHPMAAALGKKFGLFRPDGIFVRPIKGYSGDMKEFIESVFDKVNEMRIYQDPDAIVKVYNRLLRKQ